MSQAEIKVDDRPVKVTLSAEVSLGDQRFQINEFTANLAMGGAFLPTEVQVPPLTRGSITFRESHWEKPFSLQAEVVRIFEKGEDPSEPRAGLGLRFIDLGGVDRKRFERLVHGTRDGSVVESIRRSVRESGLTLEQVLRKRPTDHKLMLAIQADGKEIDALVKEGNPVVMARLLKNPRLTIPHIRKIVRDPRLTPPLLLTIRRQKEWIDDDEVLLSFCKNPKSPVQEVKQLLVNLPLLRIRELMIAPNLHPEVRAAARKFSR